MLCMRQTLIKIKTTPRSVLPYIKNQNEEGFEEELKTVPQNRLKSKQEKIIDTVNKLLSR